MAQATEDEKKPDAPATSGKPLPYETIYVGSIHLLNTSTVARHPHQCILFVSTSPDKLIPPTTVSKVTYQMHPTESHKEGWQKSFTTSPYFWSINVYGTFEWLITIDFKENTEPTPDFNKSNYSSNSTYIPKRNSIGDKLDSTRGKHTLSLTEPISITGIDPTLRTTSIDPDIGIESIIMPHLSHDEIFKYITDNDIVDYIKSHMKDKMLKEASELSQTAQSKLFFKKTQKELGSILAKTRPVLEFKGYEGRVEDVLNWFRKDEVNVGNDDNNDNNDNTGTDKQILGCNNMFEMISLMPNDVLKEIAKYIVFDINTLVQAEFDDAIEIVECKNCDINLAGIPNFKELTIKECENLRVLFNQTVTKQCEIMKSRNIHVERVKVATRPSGFRLQNSHDCTCQFLDDVNEVAFTTHGCTNISFTVKINTEVFVDEPETKTVELPDQIDDNTSIFTKWRHNRDELEFTMKAWKPHYTLGRIARA